MILHCVKVENWRSLREAVELAPLGRGVNIIHGPNEAGKSTIMDAICRGFFDRHNTAGEAMKSRQPWGSSLGPTVEMEFSLAGKRYRLKKRFLEEAMAELAMQLDSGWEKISQGATADEQIAELTFGEQTGRGLSKPEHWGLGQVLWAQQGSAVRLEVGNNQQARLRDALKITLDSTQGEAVEQAIASRYNQIYTPQGRLRSGRKNKAEVLELEEQLEAVRTRVQETEQQRASLEQLAHDLEAAEDEHEQTLGQLKQAQTDLEARRKELKALASAQREYEKLESAARETKATWERLNDQVGRIRRAEESAQKAREEAEELQEAHDRAVRSLEDVQTAYGEQKACVERLREGLNRKQKVLVAAERTVRWLQLSEQLADLSKRLGRAQGLRRQVEQAQRELGKLVAPDQRELGSLRKLDREISTKRAEVDAVSLAVRLEPDAELTIQVDADGDARPPQKVAKPTDLRALSRMGLSIDRVGKIMIRAGESDATSLAEDLTKLREKWAQKTAPFGQADLGKLEELAAQRRLLEQRVEQLEGQALDGEDADELNEQILQHQAEQAALLGQDQALQGSTQTLAQARKAAERAQESVERARADLGSAEGLLAHMATNLDEGRKDESNARGKLATARALLGDRQKQARRLAEEDGLTPEQRKIGLADTLRDMDAAQQRLDAAGKPPVENLADDINKLEAAVNRLQDDLRDQASRIGSLRQDVNRAGGQGLYSQYVEALEQHEALQRRHARAKLDADAIALLWNTLQRRKRDVFEALVKPVRLMVATTMRELVGPRYDSIDFDDHLRPTLVWPAARDLQATVEDLSFGTQEQLMLLVRLALARLLGREGDPQCVILDDPLVNTDRSRQRAALRILEQAAQDTQILVFTCHSVAYEGMAHAAQFHLKSIAGPTG